MGTAGGPLARQIAALAETPEIGNCGPIRKGGYRCALGFGARAMAS